MERIRGLSCYLRGEYCLIREVSYPLNYQHGKYTFDMLPQIVRIWNESDLKHPLSAKGFEANQMFFFDTETTGLGGGAGTSIFFLGMRLWKMNISRSDSIFYLDRAMKFRFIRPF